MSRSNDLATRHTLAATDIASGTFADARISSSSVAQHVTTYDDSKVRSDISINALRYAVNENKAAYNLPNSFIENFQDSSGIGSETGGGSRQSGEYWSRPLDEELVLVAQNVGTAIGTMTASEGLAGAFDGDTTKNSGEGARKVGGGSWGHNVGKNFGTAKEVTKIKVWGPTDEGVLNAGAAAGEHRFRIEHSADGSSWSTTWESADNFTKHNSPNAPNAWPLNGSSDEGLRTFQLVGSATQVDGSAYTATTDAWSSAGSKQYWRVNIKGNSSNGTNLAEVEFYAGETHTGDATLISIASTASSARTKCSGVILYKDDTGTSTVGTDIELYFSCDNGTNWAEATSYTTMTPVFSTGVKMVRLGETTCTSGTQIKYKLLLKNQSEGSKIASLHGIALNY